MDPLLIKRGIGEIVYAILSDLKPIGGLGCLTYLGIEGFDRIFDGCT
jgi:hypothetical protein